MRSPAIIVNITVVDAINMRNALAWIASKEEVEKEKAGKIVKEEIPRCEITGDVRYAAAKNMRALKPIITKLEDERDDLREKYQGKVDEKEHPENHAAFKKELRPLLKADHEVSLYPIQRKDLMIDTNAIPADIIEALLPIIQE